MRMAAFSRIPALDNLGRDGPDRAERTPLFRTTRLAASRLARGRPYRCSHGSLVAGRVLLHKSSGVPSGRSESRGTIFHTSTSFVAVMRRCTSATRPTSRRAWIGIIEDWAHSRPRFDGPFSSYTPKNSKHSLKRLRVSGN